LFFLGLGIIHGIFIENSPNTFFSWLFIGFWILFTIKFFRKRKEYKEYNSPKNTSFFLLGPLGIGFFYNLWGYFTGLLGENLLENYIPFFYVSLWTLIFSFPYLLYGLFIIRACYKKFNVVYLIRTKSMNARKFGFFYTFLILIGILFYIIFFNVILNYFYILVEQVYFYFDIMLLFIGLFLGYTFIRQGIFGSARSMPEISQDYINRRRQRFKTVSSTPIRTTQRTKPQRTSTSKPSRTTTSKPSTARVVAPRASKPGPARTTATRSSSTGTKVHKPKTAASSEFEKLRPKAGILSLEDFKCIFCFQLPKFPEDNRRGIVLCPNCKHPAHADEFKEWTHDSPLCSRCDASIPPSFRRNPKIISVKQYSEVINEYKKRKK